MKIRAAGGKRTVFHLSAGMYRPLGHPTGYVRAHGISAIRQEAIVLEYVAALGRGPLCPPTAPPG